VVGRAVGDEEFGKQRQYVIAIDPPGDQDRQTFAIELISH